VLLFAVRRNYLEFDRSFLMSLVKFAVSGVILAAALWATSRWSASALAGMTSLRDESALGILIVAGTIVYGVCVILLFGKRWLRALIRP
jgi:putative peptidoglycan lipid II flippase